MGPLYTKFCRMATGTYGENIPRIQIRLTVRLLQCAVACYVQAHHLILEIEDLPGNSDQLALTSQVLHALSCLQDSTGNLNSSRLGPGTWTPLLDILALGFAILSRMSDIQVIFQTEPTAQLQSLQRFVHETLQMCAPSYYRKGMDQEAQTYYELQSKCFDYIRALLQSAEAGPTRWRRYQQLNTPFTGSSLLDTLFSLVAPSSYEWHHSRHDWRIDPYLWAVPPLPDAHSRAFEARNMSLVGIVHTLSVGGIRVWLNDPSNEAYIQKWVHVIAIWMTAKKDRPRWSLSPASLFDYKNIFDPPLDPTSYWRSDEAQKVAAQVMLDKWQALKSLAEVRWDLIQRGREPKGRGPAAVDWITLASRTLMVLKLLSLHNAAGFIGSELFTFILSFPDSEPTGAAHTIQDPEGIFSALKAAMETLKKDFEQRASDHSSALVANDASRVDGPAVPDPTQQYVSGLSSGSLPALTRRS